MADPDDDLAAAAADLAASLEALRDDVAPRPRRGPLGLPRPPRPVEVLRFADNHAIPTAIALLEANVRALKLLRAALRLADPERSATRDALSEGGDTAAARVGEVGREALRQADSALEDLLDAVEGGALPPDADARDVVADARRLRAEIDERLAEAGGSADGAAATDDSEPPGAADEGPLPGGDEPVGEDRGTTIDVEAELESIRSEVGDGEAASDDATGERDGDEREVADGDAAVEGDDAADGDAAADTDVADGDDAVDGTAPDGDDGEPDDAGEAA